MKKQKLFVWWMALMVIATLVPKQLRAQAAAQPGQHFVVQVEGLTNEDRDAVQTQLRGRQDLKLVFACVPAGIMVFEADANGTRAQAKQRATPVMQSRMANKRTTDLDSGIAEAEAACAQQRDR